MDTLLILIDTHSSATLSIRKIAGEVTKERIKEAFGFKKSVSTRLVSDLNGQRMTFRNKKARLEVLISH